MKKAAAVVTGASRGAGKGIAIAVDHGDNAKVRALFDQVMLEQGRLDILVNNACALHNDMTAPGNFWEIPLEIVDMLNVGLRSSDVSGWLAAPMMVKQGRGLILFTSASGAVH